ncbi:MAG: hypothetical protein JF607_09235 [Burkholderiales bacterium]|jgi:hypothetical protein|nr:hypothetical protein [Burkholderiales bacterium]MBW8892054.1 hypothetical protein [Burkholderiales bacterium]
MIVPNHWAEARTTVRVKGRNATLRRFGWSDESPADAQTKAELRVAEAARLAVGGNKVPRRELKRAYNGADGVPIREEVLARHGEAVITRNAYGARCLNVLDLLIADVDFNAEPDWWLRVSSRALAFALAVPMIVWNHDWKILIAGVLVLLFGAKLLLKPMQWLAENVAPPAADLARNRVAGFVSRNAGWRVRLYRTPAGIRLIATHARMAPNAAQTREFFDAVGTDPVYARMCLNQNCFRARLTAKPWRIGIPDHLKPRPGVWPIRPERMAARDAWVRRYEREAEAFAACHYEETLGHGSEDPGLAPLVALHDAQAKALDDIRPLA